ncbi:polysaccharide deacetylase (NodB), putative [Talaromyces stipitatus ATCC 10500]|uniref:chitin deacetylase n=1 Tax=Talaromyces stipitatus (strain ATCC 10500 / CBS 375.48 / QM 6759 / NRRL 1006) TaxID=441959 RepID=B8M7X4_TALSN|nr:polysaccharide deacetylase (NodB), putative [Talaromyces stipitatus ATCC 10500]EED19853.1 polysaccharide deacetylase (NodB), putative [Talaromyces stipitatus ATCC 10500]
MLLLLLLLLLLCCHPDVLWQVSTPEKVIALTIDDGPSIYTAEILEILEANHATATFFIIGSHVSKLKDDRDKILQGLIRGGNELGNHGMYDEPACRLPDDELVSQINAVDKVIQNAYEAVNTVPMDSNNTLPRYYRPGSGWYTTRMRNIVSRLRYKLVLGDVYPHDPQIPFAKVNAAHILRMARPGGIIICHDGRPWTLPMLRSVLPELKRRGYKVVHVTELLRYADS